MVRFAVKIAGKTGKRKQRSGRGGAGIGFAARKQAEMDLRMQRSGREGVVVGLAAWEHVETEGCRHDGTCTGAAKRTGAGRCMPRYTGKGNKQRRKDENRIRDARSLRSGRGGAGVGFAARKHTEMGLRVQRSGQERAVVGFTTWGTGTNRDGRTGTEQETHGICEADGKTLGYASLLGNRLK